MSIHKIEDPENLTVTFPPSTVDLVFKANALPSTTADVTYTILSPKKVLFDNGTKQDTLAVTVLGDAMDVKKAVRFRYDGAAPPSIEIKADVYERGGTRQFGVRWTITVSSASNLKAFEAHLPDAALVESIQLIKRLCELLPALEERLHKGES